MGITINGWGKNKKPNTIYLRGYKCYGHDKDDKKKWNTTCLNANGLTKLNGFVCTSCF